MKLDTVLTVTESRDERIDMLELNMRALEQRVVMQEKLISAMHENILLLVEVNKYT